MKRLWNSFLIAFAMFSKLPVPQADWNAENMKYMLCFFPLVGAVCGALELLLFWACSFFHPANGFRAALMVLIPLLVTGGIHVDGLLDTADAMSSWQERSRRLEILKDSHAGAFAIIACCGYFLAFYGACQQFGDSLRAVLVFSLTFVLARCLSGYGVLTLPKASAEGLVSSFSKNAEERPVRMVLVVFMAVLGVLMMMISPAAGAAVVICSLLVFWGYRRMALKYFGGTSGDLSGFFLCTCEVCAALAIAVVWLVTG